MPRGAGWPWRGVAPRVVRATIGAAWLLAFAGAAQAVALAGIPPGAALPTLVGGLVVSALPVAVPVGVLYGVTAELRAAARDGRWLALGAMGRPPHRTLRALVAGAGLLAGALVAGEHLVFPRARAALAGVRAEAVVAPAPGAQVRIGDWTLARDPHAPEALPRAGGETPAGAAVHAISGTGAAPLQVTATSLVSVPGARGRVAELGPGTLHVGAGESRVGVSFTRLAAHLPGGGGGGGLPVDARPTGSFVPRGPYEGWIVLKRTIVPALLAPLVVVAAALGVRGHAPAAWLAGGVVASAWGLVRLLDGLVRGETLGVAPAAAVLVVGACLGAWLARRALA